MLSAMMQSPVLAESLNRVAQGALRELGIDPCAASYQAALQEARQIAESTMGPQLLEQRRAAVLRKSLDVPYFPQSPSLLWVACAGVGAGICVYAILVRCCPC